MSSKLRQNTENTYMKEYCEANKDKISTEATSFSEEHDRTEYYQDYYASNLELSLCHILTSGTARPLRRAIGSLLHGPRPVTIRLLRRTILNLLYGQRPAIIWTLRTARLQGYHMDSEKSCIKSTAQFKPYCHAN